MKDSISYESIKSTLVQDNNKQAYWVSSLNISDTFDKRHPDVKRDVRNLLEKDVSNSAHISKMFINYQEADKMNRLQDCYWMNRDGFTLLAMGFTGDKALGFKLEYIKAFNEMEKTISEAAAAVALPDFTNQVLMARAWADEVEQKQLAQTNEKIAKIETEKAIEEKSIVEKEVKRLQPKADLAERAIEIKGIYDIGETAKLLSLSYGRNTLFKNLRESGLFFQNKNEPKQQYINQGLFQIKIVPIRKGSFEENVTKVYVTSKGLKWIHKILKESVML